MTSLFDYLTWRGDLPLERVPLCPVDALILSELSYVHFGPLISEQGSVPIGRAAEGYLAAPHAAPALERFDAVTPLRYPLVRAPERLPLAMGLLSVVEPGLARVAAVCARARAVNGRQGGYALEEVALYGEA